MKTLYIHGLDSYPVPEKLGILEHAGLEVEALHLDYRTEKQSYQILRDFAIEEEIQFIIGSSLGGYIGYWLGEELGLPCLLFNPAMSYSDTLDEHMPDIDRRLCPARYVAIGAWDETVDPQQNLRFFRENQRDECYERVVVCEWLSHQIDFTSFEELVHWALNSHRLFLEQNK